jgi:hypothetical protein
MRPLPLFQLLAFTIFSSAWAQDAPSGFERTGQAKKYDQCWALVVGINYSDAKTVAKLDNAENDAQSIGKLLSKSFGFKVESLLGNAATGKAIKEHLLRLESQVGENDCFLFYFAGHGISEGDMPVLYPADVETEDGKIVDTVPAYEIVRSKLKALHSVYVFDSCYSGQIAQLLDRVPPFREMKRRQGEPKFESRSVQILTSSANNQKAKDGTDGRSPFSKAIENGLGQLGELQSSDRVSMTELHEFIRRGSRGQESQFLTLLPDAGSTSGGDFCFFGRAPYATKSVVFQTLPGTYATLPGLPLARSWFDESPWLTPGIRLLADGEFGQGGRERLGTPEMPAAGFRDPHGVAKQLLQNDTGAFEQSVIETAKKLETLGNLKDSEYFRLIDEVLGSLRNRGAATPTDIHTSALLTIARSKRQGTRSDDKLLIELNQQFLNAVDGYLRDKKYGLHARCLADHAHWLLDECPKYMKGESKEYSQFQLAAKYFEEAISVTSDTIGIERFKIELHAGAAYALRQRAKGLVAESLPNETESWRRRRDAQAAWRDASEHYDAAVRIANDAKLSDDDPVFSYLNERIAWLRMDLWDIEGAATYFSKAIEKQVAAKDLVAFLGHASSLQGLAMTKRLRGESAKSALTDIQQSVRDRLARAENSVEEKTLLHERLGNVTERLAECDFLTGRSGLVNATTEFKRGLHYCREWRENVTSRSAEEESVDKQEFRLICKLIIASVLLDDGVSRRQYGARFEQLMNVRKDAVGVVNLLGELAEAFHGYGKAKVEEKDYASVQEALGAIRAVIQRNATASLDREPAELLLSVANTVSVEQERLDAKIRIDLLPKEAGDSNKLPRNIPVVVRRQYDSAVVMLGRSYSGQVPALEFERFRSLVRNVQQSAWTDDQLLRPFVLFFLPIDGSNGLVLISYGDDDAKRRGGEVYPLGFGWKNPPQSIDGSVLDFITDAMRANPELTVGWTDDSYLKKAGFSAPCPSFVKNENKPR